jgi:hypothetical protein
MSDIDLPPPLQEADEITLPADQCVFAQGQHAENYLVVTLQAALDVDGTERGEVEFRNPVEPGKILLDFDPRGQQIDVLDGATVILETLFPSS